MNFTKAQKRLLESIDKNGQGQPGVWVELFPTELRVARNLEKMGIVELNGDFEVRRVLPEQVPASSEAVSVENEIVRELTQQRDRDVANLEELGNLSSSPQVKARLAHKAEGTKLGYDKALRLVWEILQANGVV